MIKERGRPKQYDAETALQAAGLVFWAKGYNGTSLDDLSLAMEMNRPSIYRAFGDKKEIYRLALAQFAKQMDSAFNLAMLDEKDFQKGLGAFFKNALDIYSSSGSTLGCMFWCTAPAAAFDHPDVQADLLNAIKDVDKQILKQVDQAIKQGQLHKDTDAVCLSKMIQALLHSIAIRARAGESKVSLRKFADSAVLLLLTKN
tara:strand:- start:306 stop:908 length:603 start_codon:yes stop_codon:yes gene_type:complete